MSEIHFNVEAVQAFCSDLAARRESLEERLRDEKQLFDLVFDSWRDHRAQAVRTRLDELTQTIQSATSDIDDLIRTMRDQIRAAEEYLGGPNVY
jgi:uncharacterized protein YukE